MKVEITHFTHAMAQGEKQIGLWFSLSGKFVAESMAPAGFDGAQIDGLQARVKGAIA